MPSGGFCENGEDIDYENGARHERRKLAQVLNEARKGATCERLATLDRVANNMGLTRKETVTYSV